MTRTKLLVCAALLATSASALNAQVPIAGTTGTYSLVGGEYVIQVIFSPAKVTIVEPNKTSHYDWDPTRKIYEFYNQKTDAWYGIRIISPTRIEASKPRLNPGPPPSYFELKSTTMTEVRSPEYDRYMAIANKYKDLGEKNVGKGDTQAYTFCAAAAFSRATQTKEDADWYGRDAATRLKPIMVNGKNPCPDAIPDTLWPN